jgi:hypothetical protein
MIPLIPAVAFEAVASRAVALIIVGDLWCGLAYFAICLRIAAPFAAGRAVD